MDVNDEGRGMSWIDCNPGITRERWMERIRALLPGFAAYAYVKMSFGSGPLTAGCFDELRCYGNWNFSRLRPRSFRELLKCVHKNFFSALEKN